MKTELVSVRLRKDELESINEMAKEEKTDKTTALRKTLALGTKQYLLEKVLKEYSQGKISIGKAAEKAKVSLWEMMDELKSRNISNNLDRDDYQEQLNNLKRVLK